MDEQASKKVIRDALLLVKVVRQAVSNFDETAASLTALLQTIFGRFPELHEQYEQRFEQAKIDSPLVGPKHQLVAQLRQVEADLEKVLKA